MCAQTSDSAAPQTGPPLRRYFWDGVLPEALGLCFVAIILGGFIGAYLIADYSYQQDAAETRQAEADRLAQMAASLLGPAGAMDDGANARLLETLATAPGIRSLRWTAPTGEERFCWPPIDGAGAPSPARDESDMLIAAVPVRTAAGEPAGVLRIEVRAAPPQGHAWHSAGSWGIVAAVTLLVFTIAYRRLRHHLRPVAAIERSLQSFAHGVEEELAALTLSDSLGSVAQGWNLLIGQLGELQQQLESTQQEGQTKDVLARFEGAVFRRMVDGLPFGVLCLGGDHTVTYANTSAGALLGRPTDELLGNAVSDGIEDAGVVQVLTSKTTPGGAGRSVDHTRTESGHETTLRFRVLPLSEHSAAGDVMVTIEDIGQLREDQRARDNFLYHVTHELRTPLTSIHAYAETLTKPGFDDEQTRKECYNVIISETRRLSTLVEDILSLSQLEVGTARLDVGEVDLLRLMRQMVQDNLGAADEKRLDLTLTLPPKVPKIRGDKQRLAVLLTNLIGNGIKYTPEDGGVHVNLDVTDQSVLISVRDTGIGIATEDQTHIFDKFYRAADDRVQEVTGTGLGLAIAREVAHLHGGEIRLESAPDQGSTFTIELPRPTNDQAEVSVR